jgi:HAD superfamily hydrolase (TIGR01549 family)
VDALRRARHSGFRIAVVSNGDARRQRAKINAMCLEDIVDGCVISGEVGVRKPDRRIFEIAAERAGADLDGRVR